VGEVSEPIKIGDRYSIFKVIAEKTIELNPQQWMKVEQDFGRIKFDLEKAALVEELKNKYRLEVDREGLKVFVEGLRHGASFATEDKRNTVLYRYDKGRITAGDLVDVAMDRKGDVLASLTQGDQVISFAEKYVIPAMMIMEAALGTGMDEEEEIATWLKDQRRPLLLAELRRKVLEGKIDLSAEALRPHYDGHPKKYLHPEQLDIQEILVETEAEALRLIEKIQEGVPMGELARKYSIRPVQDQGDAEGRFHFHEHESPHFGGLVKAAFEAEIGELKGPVEVNDGYSIFKVLSRERKRETFAEAEWRVRRDVKRIKSREIFNRYVEGLRNEYESHVSVRGDNLKAAFEMR
jgi:parvulin-like peptidyl-prolyl isomerase